MEVIGYMFAPVVIMMTFMMVMAAIGDTWRLVTDMVRRTSDASS